MTVGYRVDRPLTGIVLKVASVASFVAMMACIKGAGMLPLGQIVFFRSLFAVLPILVFLVYRKELATALHTRHPMSHVLRGIVGVIGMSASFYGLTLLPLPDAITINYAQPLFVIVFSALFLGETVRMYRWSAVIAGMIGVTIISWPKLSVLTGTGLGVNEATGVITLLFAAMTSAIAMLLVRKLVETEPAATIVIWFSLLSTLFGLATWPFGWENLSMNQTILLISSGLAGGIGQLFLTESYRHADMSTIAPFEYTSMVLGIAVGYFLFSDIPTIETLVGGSIVVGAGVFIIWREHQLGLERKRARRVMPP